MGSPALRRTLASASQHMHNMPAGGGCRGAGPLSFTDSRWGRCAQTWSTQHGERVRAVCRWQFADDGLQMTVSSRGDLSFNGCTGCLAWRASRHGRASRSIRRFAATLCARLLGWVGGWCIGCCKRKGPKAALAVRVGRRRNKKTCSRSLFA
jgi:hypothetical protein